MLKKWFVCEARTGENLFRTVFLRENGYNTVRCVLEPVREKTLKKWISSRGLKKLRLKLGVVRGDQHQKTPAWKLRSMDKLFRKNIPRAALYLVRT